MLGSNSPRGSQEVRGHDTSRRGRWALGAGLALMLGSAQNNCGFPTYTFPLGASGGGGSPGAMGGTAGGAPTGGGQNGGAAGSAGVDPGAGGMGADAGAAGAAGAAGSGGEVCVYPEPVQYPPHCFDKLLGDGETGIDCGGGACLPCDGDQACVHDSDCTSGACTTANTCSPLLRLQYESIVTGALTPTPKFHLIITYLDSKQTALANLTIRYYFNHNGVVEPVIPLDTQATVQVGNSPSNPPMSWKIHRLPPGLPDASNRTTDSYLEITSTSQLTLTAGATLDLTQDIVAGNLSSQFDQNSHYSFLSVNTLTVNEAITVYRKDASTGVPIRIWGVDPPLTVLPDCAYAYGVNLGGNAIAVGGRQLAASAGQTQFTGTPYASTAHVPLPATDAATTTMLSTAFPLSSTVGATWTAVQSGQYWAYAWLTSAASADTGTLSLQGNAADQFSGTQAQNSSYWALIGPYLVTIAAADGGLQLTSSGNTNVSGLMLYRAKP